MSDQEVNQTPEAKIEEKPDYSISTRDGVVLYNTNAAELDECFYSVIALMSWSKTFNVGSKLKVTLTTISEDDKMTILSSVKKWAESEKASSQMFDEQMNKYNICYYVSYIEIDGNGINLREKDVEARMKFLGTMTETALSLYGTYVYAFLEILRKSMLSQVSLKNS